MEKSMSEQYLWRLIHDGLYKLYGDNIPQEVIDRINIEMDVIVPNKFDDYILVIWDIHDFCKTPSRVFEFCERKGITPPPDGIIPLGPGRGSVGGSYVCYCIGIHECDPLLFGLYFERFLNPERIAYPDIDFDISQKYRHIGLAYIADTYGEEYVSQIITYGTLSLKTVIHDVMVTACIPNSVINTVKATIPDDPSITLSKMLDDKKFIDALNAIEFPNQIFTVDASNIQRIINNNKFECDDDKINKHNRETILGIMSKTIQSGTLIIKSSWNVDRLIYVMSRLEGLCKNESTHAAGVVVAPVTLEDNIPLFRKSGTGVLASQYDMISLEEIGYLKMDALGLRTVDVNHEAERLVKQWYDPQFSIRDIRYDDKDTIDLINSGDTIGIFQIESTGFTKMMQDLDIGGYETERYADRNNNLLSQVEKIRGLEVKDFMWISAGLALYRPGPLDAIIDGKTMVQHLIDRKSGKEPIIYLFDEEKGYLEETYGVLVYQEQVMARVRQMTGCSLGRADILRKAMGKKNPVLMKEQMDWFVESAMKHQFSEKIIVNKSQIVDRAKEEIEKFARYGFNKAHTVEYGHICYRNAYFKKHYPTAFYTAILNSENGNPKRQTILIRDMLAHDIQLSPPDINKSDLEFTMTDINTISFGLSSIKNIGGRAVGTIIDDRSKNGDYKSLHDFRIRIPSTDCNITGITNLAKCGAFDNICINVDGEYSFNNRASLVETIPGICDIIKKLSAKKGKDKPKPTVAEVKQKWINGGYKYSIIHGEDDPIQYALWEKEILTYYISAHPIDKYTDEIRRYGSIEDTELEDLPNEFYIVGFVESCHETVIKKEGRNKGKAMGFLSIGTAYKMYEATMFPGIYESCLPYIKTGNPIVLKGKRDTYRDVVTIQCIYVRGITNTGVRDCPECHLRIDKSITPAQIIQLKSICNEHPGMTKMFIHILDGYNDITIECTQTIALNDHIIEFAESIGQLSYKPIPLK